MNLCFCMAPATTGSYCSEHLARLRRDLHRAPDVIRDLDITIVGLAQQGGGGNGSETPLAFNERASDARQDLLYLLASAANIGHPAPRGTTLTPANLAARALHGVDTIARSPAAHTIAQDLHDAMDEAAHVRDRAEEKISYGPCECGVELIAPKSKDEARCRNPDCGKVWRVAELRAFRHVAALERLEGYRGKLADVVKLLNYAGHQVKLNTAIQWVKRKKLAPGEDGLFSAKNVKELSRKG